MKTIITTLFCAVSFITLTHAQTPTTVSMGNAYANNIWYSFANGNAGSSSAMNWDIALAATTSTSSPIVTSVLFNSKQGTLFVAPDALTPVDDFADLDTTGMANTWSKLYNDDKDWGVGAFNQVGTKTHPDYGWGTYDGVAHTGFAARRIFVIRYGNGSTIPFTYKKLYLSLTFAGGTYTIKYDKLDNSDPQTGTVVISNYAGKDFGYYSLVSNSAIDREPVNTAWDVLFTQYTSTSELYKSNPSSASPGAANQLVGGVLLNKNVTAAQANNVADRTTYQDAASQTFISDINTIGWDWKYLRVTTWEVVTDTVYFVQLTNDDIYSLYFTSFGGTSTGNFNFTQQKVSTVTAVFGEASDKASLAVYPNPTATGNATVIYDFSNNNNAVLTVSDLTGNVVYTKNIQSAAGLNAYTFSTASLNSGLYVVSLNTNGGVLQQKLMVK